MTNNLGNPHNGVVSKESLLQDHSAVERMLKDATASQQVGLEGLPAVRYQLVKVFGRIDRLACKIDEAFAGQPFLPNLSADAPANRRRFNAYVEGQRKAIRLLGQAIELWMLTCGMKKEDDWVPLLIAEMHQNAAAKATQANASQSGTGVKSSAVPDLASRRRHVC
jgi:hypothetical protein